MAGNASRLLPGAPQVRLQIDNLLVKDIRGKYHSEGDYVMTRPLRGPLNSSEVDHSTDAYDTIDWLVKNVPESNGKVGMLGSSYEGFTVVMALVHPHPALKVAAPMSPMVDGWMGDDWFHFGAFRQNNLDYIAGQTEARGEGGKILRHGLDDYDNYLRAGSLGDFAKAAGMDQMPFWKKITEHPSYDAFWQNQALDKTMGEQPLTVPTMWIQGLWDQEDMWGAIHCYLAVEPKDTNNDKNYLVMGPWRHSGVNYEGSTLGPLRVGWRHRAAISPRCAAAIFRSIFARRFTESGYASGIHLQHRRESLGSAEIVAACLPDVRGEIEAVVSRDEFRPVIRRPDGARSEIRGGVRTNTFPIRPGRCLTCRVPSSTPTAIHGGAGC